MLRTTGDEIKASSICIM